jgi:hypothetical protein
VQLRKPRVSAGASGYESDSDDDNENGSGRRRNTQNADDDDGDDGDNDYGDDALQRSSDFVWAPGVVVARDNHREAYDVRLLTCSAYRHEVC